jgi:hypothetical protein
MMDRGAALLFAQGNGDPVTSDGIGLVTHPEMKTPRKLRGNLADRRDQAIMAAFLYDDARGTQAFKRKGMKSRLEHRAPSIGFDQD